MRGPPRALPGAPEPWRDPDAEPFLRIQGVTRRFGRFAAVDDVSLDIYRGELFALLGGSGSGKTTLLRALAGALDPAAGSVEASCRVALVPQEPDSLLFAPTVRAEVTETVKLLGRRDDGAVDRWLAALDLVDLADRHPRSLSVGERQRVAIAAVAVGDAPVLVLDEPTRGIDAPSRAALEKAIAEHAAGGGAVVLATHDVELAARTAHRVVVLAEGEVVAEGAAAEVLAGSLFAPQVLRVLPPFLTVEAVAGALGRSAPR